MLGENELCGLRPITEQFGSLNPMINDELLYKIRYGKVFPRMGIKRFEGETVIFEDGREQ
jgi:hypothetical protein